MLASSRRAWHASVNTFIVRTRRNMALGLHSLFFFHISYLCPPVSPVDIWQVANLTRRLAVRRVSGCDAHSFEEPTAMRDVVYANQGYLSYRSSTASIRGDTAE